MAGQQALLLVGFLLPGLLLSEAAKILTLSLVGGSHFLLMNRVSQILQDHGCNVTMLLQRGNLLPPGFTEEEKSYKVINWFLPEDDNKEFKKSFHFFMEETFEGRSTFEHVLAILEQLGLPCSHLLGRNDTMNSLKNENFRASLVISVPRHPHVHLFVTHGGINSVMEAIQHGLLMVEIPLFGDQPENLLRVDAKNFGVSIQLKQIKAETLALNMKQVIEDKRQKSAMVDTSIMKRSHPLTPSQRLVGWINHILQTGGAAHLKPHTFQQPWWEQYLLEVLLFLLVVTLGTSWLCGHLLGLVAGWLYGTRKLKKA
nr:UDP-glucuronosyltransferase 3A2 [Globicephala melas]